MADKKATKKQSSDTPPANTDKPNIDAIVEEINSKVGDTLYNMAIEVGNIILNKFFGNDIKTAKSKSKDKDSSYRQLAERTDLKIHFTQLNQMVRLAIQEKEWMDKLPKDKREKLNLSQRVELLKLDKVNDKVEYAKKCIDNNWSVRQLRDEIKKYLESIPHSVPKRSTQLLSYVATLTESTKVGLLEGITVKEIDELPYDKLKIISDAFGGFDKQHKVIKTNIDRVKKNVDDRISKLKETSTKLDSLSDNDERLKYLKGLKDKKELMEVACIVQVEKGVTDDNTALKISKKGDIIDRIVSYYKQKEKP